MKSKIRNLNLIIENNPSLLKKNDISSLSLEAVLLIFTEPQIQEEELQICALEMLNLTLVRLDSDSEKFFQTNWQFFQNLCQICSNLFFNSQKNSLLFKTVVKFIGNLLCKCGKCEELLSIEGLFLECFESLKFQQRSSVSTLLIWLLKILTVYISSFLKSNDSNSELKFQIYFSLGRKI